MKILHVYSMAGVAEMLCTDESIVMQLKGLDPFGFSEYYNKTFIFDDTAKLLQAAHNSSYNADYVILHDFVEFYSEFPQENLVLFFHGTKLRDVLKNDPMFNSIKDKLRIIVSTPDLLSIVPNAFYLPVPIDDSLFAPNLSLRERNYLAINRDYQIDTIKPTILGKYPEVEYINRQKEIIPYRDMPNLLNKYYNYVDWKFDYNKPIPQTINATSCTGLQALSCGLNVWTSEGVKLSPDILLEHNIDTVREKFLRYLNV